MNSVECRETRNNLSLAETIQSCLSELNENVVFAESCTGGEIASTMAKLPGISQNFCGSFVSYRGASKSEWLGVDCRTINKYTTESIEVAEEMAVGALKNTPEASWALAVVGHFGPNAPKDKDGMIYLCIVRRTSKGTLKVKELIQHHLIVEDRVSRQKTATEVCLTSLARILMKRASSRKSKDDSKNPTIGR